MDAILKQQVEGEVTKLKTDFKAYKLEMAAKKKTFQPSGPPPPAVSITSSRRRRRIVLSR